MGTRKAGCVSRGAVQDVLQVCGALSADENANRKALLDRIVAMLTKFGQRGYVVHEDSALYTAGTDTDTDSDPDAEGNQEQIANHCLEATLDSAPEPPVRQERA